MANSTDPFGKQVFGGQTSMPPGGTSAAATGPAAAGPAMPWKSFNQYWTDKGQIDEANKYSAYRSNYLPGTTQSQQWGAGGDPYRFAEEYNQYKTTLPQQYQDLMNYGISPEQVQSGQIKGIMGGSGLEPVQMPVAAGAAPGSAGVYGAGSGSTNSLAPEVLKKMWR